MSMGEIEAIETAIESLRRGWGATCEVRDIDDAVPLPTSPKDYDGWLDSRCQGCRAKEVIAFLEQHRDYLKENATN